MIGWIFLLAPMAVVLYAGIRVVPEYLNYYKVITALKETANQLKADEVLSPAAIRISIQKRFDTGYVDEPTSKEIVIAKGDTGWSMTADYEKVVPLFGNIHLLMVFKSTVVIN
jgi:hypothetical protein